MLRSILAISLLAPVLCAQGFRPLPPLAFTARAGLPSPLPQIVTVASAGSDFQFTATGTTFSGGAWLTASGCAASCATPRALTVAVNSGALAPGNYTGQVHLQGQNNAFSLVFAVNLTVTPGAESVIDTLPGHVSFSLRPGGTNSAKHYLRINNPAGSPSAWTITSSTSDGGAWINVDAPSGNSPSQVAISLAQPNLPGGGSNAGVFLGQIRFEASGRAITVPVTVTVGGDILAHIPPLAFVTPVSSGPLPQILTFASLAGAVPYDLAVNTSRGGDWLQVTGCLAACDTPRVNTVHVNPAGLVAGDYTAQIVATPQSGYGVLTIPVLLRVVPQGEPYLTGLQGHGAFMIHLNNNANPKLALQTRNGGAAPVLWTVETSTADGTPWFDVDVRGGATGLTPITAVVSLKGFERRNFASRTELGQILFRSPGGDVTIPVSAVVGGVVFDTPGELRHTVRAGDNTHVDTGVNVYRTAIIPMFTAAYSAGGVPWLAIVPCAGACTPRDIQLLIDPGGLPPGIHTGQVVAVESAASRFATTIPVFLSVTDGVPARVTGNRIENQTFTLSDGIQITAGVSDRFDIPVKGAPVTFTAPPSGPSGFFFPGMTTETTVLSQDFGSALTSWLSNTIPGGPFSVVVSTPGATSGELRFINVAANCFFIMGTALPAISAAGGTSTSTFTADPGCRWDLISKASWLSLVSPATGDGSASISVTARENLGRERLAPILGGRMYFPVTQESRKVFTETPQPASGAGSTQTFHFPFPYETQPDVLNILINNAIDGRGACYIAYVRTSSSLFLVNDAGDAGGPFAGGFTLPGTGTASNSQCSIDAAGSSVLESSIGGRITLTLAIRFAPSFAGNRTFYMAARDGLGANSGWQARGVWRVPSTAPAPVVVRGIVPESVSSKPAAVSLTFSPSPAFGTVDIVNLLVNSALDGRGACYLAFVRPTGTLFLVNDAGEAGGPFAGSIVLPGTGAVSNSQCTVRGEGSTVVTNGSELTLNLNITFKPSFEGYKVAFAAGRKDNGSNSGWQPVGTIAVPYVLLP